MMNYGIAQSLLEGERFVAEEQYQEVVAPSLTGSSRWSIEYEAVYKHIETETYWRLSWTRGATEYQDEGNENLEFEEVVPVSMTVIRYIEKE